MKWISIKDQPAPTDRLIMVTCGTMQQREDKVTAGYRNRPERKWATRHEVGGVELVYWMTAES